MDWAERSQRSQFLAEKLCRAHHIAMGLGNHLVVVSNLVPEFVKAGHLIFAKHTGYGPNIVSASYAQGVFEFSHEHRIGRYTVDIVTHDHYGRCRMTQIIGDRLYCIARFENGFA